MTLQETTWVATTRLRIANNRLEVVLNREDYNRLTDQVGGTIRLKPRVLDRGLVLWLRDENARRVGVHTVSRLNRSKRTDLWAKTVMRLDAGDLSAVARWFDLATFKNGVLVRFRVSNDELVAIRDGEGDVPAEVATPPERLGIVAEMETGPGRNYPAPSHSSGSLPGAMIAVLIEGSDGVTTRTLLIPAAQVERLAALAKKACGAEELP